MKLNVVYRCRNYEVDKPVKVRNVRPPWFCKKRCFSSLAKSVLKHRSLVDNFIIIHDGEEGSLLEHIKNFGDCDIIKTNIPGIYEGLTDSYRIIDNLQNKNIYVVEDDYLHSLDSIQVLYHGLLHYNFVSGYDHLAHYQDLPDKDITDGKEYIQFLPETNRHWRTVESTCMTVAFSEKIYFTVVNYAKRYLDDRDMYRKLITEQNIRLWTPIPGVCTHANECMSPGVDWEAVAKTI
jgi:hypothetical protein